MKSNSKIEWQFKNLAEVCDFQNGFAFKSKFFKPAGLPVLRISNIQNENLETEDLVFFDPKDYKENFEKFCVEKGDLVIAMSGATTGKLGINNSDTIFYLNQRVGKFLPKENLAKKYLHYFLSTRVEENLRISAGSAQPNLSTEQIKNLEIPFPPIGEQKRIVKILDEVFEGIAKVKETTDKNLKNAREVFESYLQSVFDHSKQNWKSKDLGKLSKINYGYTEKASFKEIGPKFLRITDIQDGKVHWSSVPYCKIPNAELPKYLLENGDIVFARTGATTGKSFLINSSPASVFASYLIRLKIQDLTIILPEFLYLFFQTKTYWDKIQIGVSGSAQGGFNASKLSEFQIPLPPLSEQKSIVAKLDALSAETKKLEELYKQKLTHLEELKKSILKKAFNGEL